MAEDLKYPWTVGLALGIVDDHSKSLGFSKALQCIVDSLFQQHLVNRPKEIQAGPQSYDVIFLSNGHDKVQLLS